MLQQRAHHKHHSPLLWTIICCIISVGETIFKLEAAVDEEMGL
jgi:hypothetical protein